MTELGSPVIGIQRTSSALRIVRELSIALEESVVDYCRWQSTLALDGSPQGESDLDILIRRSDIGKLAEVLHRLGFKQAYGPSDIHIPEVQSYYGYDHESDRFVHVHAHFQLILTHEKTKDYRLPIEEPFLDAAIYDDVVRKAPPEYEFIVYVVRMVLKHSTWDAILGRRGALSATEQKELSYLRARTNSAITSEIMRRHLPFIEKTLFDDCVQALMPERHTWLRVRAGQRLRRALKPYARNSPFKEVCLRLWRRGLERLRRRALGHMPKKRLASGGVMIAFIGGDGAGKSTVVSDLHAWLSDEFDVIKVHMGKPPWSLTTKAVRSVLKVGRLIGLYPYTRVPSQHIADPTSNVFPGYPWLLREVCAARDRNHAYSKARRYANNGGIVICDRYPLPQITIMDGYRSDLMASVDRSDRLAVLLMKVDEGYYQQIAPPDLLILLKVDPEIAVRRKLDEDPASVRARSKMMWELNWQETPDHVVDASQSQASVLAETKAVVWSKL